MSKTSVAPKYLDESSTVTDEMEEERNAERAAYHTFDPDGRGASTRLSFAAGWAAALRWMSDVGAECASQISELGELQQ